MPDRDKDIVDKFYCTPCGEYVFAMSPAILAERLNNHNKLKHPLDFCRWTAETVILSAQYSGPTKVADGYDMQALFPEARLDAMTVHSTESKNNWGSAEKPPDITELDKIFLRGGLVRWDD